MENNTSANVSESSPDSSATLVFIRLPLYTLLPLAKPSGCTTLQACMCLSDTERVSCLFSIKRTKFFWAKCFDVYMQVKSSSQPISDEIFKHLVSESASFRKLSASNDISSTFWPFDMTTEAPKPGLLLGIDAEFVALSASEKGSREDGVEFVKRPARLSLARVSVVRGEGDKAGVCCIDDYICMVKFITAADKEASLRYF
jgi:hypothetical protein